LCYLFYLDMVYLTTLLLVLLATSDELVGMWRSVATVFQKLTYTISGLWEHSPAITASQQIQHNMMNFNVTIKKRHKGFSKSQ
jgi:hypothetical protein